MSEVIEERVAKLVFDNSAFEKYAKESLETLGRFEDKMDSFAKDVSVVDLGKNMISGFKDVTSTIDKVGKKYSWLEQIAVGAYRKIGESATNYLKTELFKLTGVSEAVSGWQKYESEVESVQSIMNATGLDIESVEAQLKKLSWYTDETSYKYGDMVANIAKFNAAGISDLGEATDSMIGIANMAGYFGVNATKASHAMGGFAKAMGVGYMGNDSWKWIETAGMNAADIQKAFIDTAAELGKIKKVGDGLFEVQSGKSVEQFTYEQFKTVLAKKWLDKEVMNATFAKYSKSINDIYSAWQEGGEIETVSTIMDRLGDSIDETSRKAFKAAQETKTFTDAVGALEEVVSSGWRTTFKIIFGNYEEARDLWSGVVDEVWDLFAGAGYARNELLAEWKEAEGRTTLIESIANIWYGIKAFIGPIKDAFDTIFPATTVERLLALTNAFKDFSERFRSFFDFGFNKNKKEENPVTETVEETIEVTETFEEACERTRQNLDRLYNEINSGKWGTGINRWKALGEQGFVWQIVQNEVNRRYNAALGYQAYGMHEVVDDGYLKKQTRLETVTKEITKAIEKQGDATEGMTATQLKAQRRADALNKSMLGLFAAIDLVKDIAAEVGKFFGKTFGKVVSKLAPAFDSILEVTSKWGVELLKIRNKFPTKELSKIFDNASEKVADFVANFINGAVPAIINFGKTAVDWIGKISNALWPIIKTVGGALHYVITNLPGWIGKIKDVLWPIIETVGGVLYYTIKKLPGLIGKIYKKAKPIFDNIKNGIGPTLESIKDWIKNVAWPFVSNLPKTVIPFIENTYKKCKKFITDVWNNLVGSEGVQKIKSTLKKAWESIKQFGKDAWEYLKESGSNFAKTFSGLFENVKDEEGNIDWAKVFAAGVDWLLGKLSDFIGVLGDLGGKVRDFFGLFKSDEAQDMEFLAASIGDSTEKIDNIATNKLGPLKTLIENVFGVLKEIVGFLKDPFDYVLGGMKTVIDGIVGLFEGLNIEKLSGFFKDTGIGLFFAALAKSLAQGAGSIASIPEAFAKVLFSLESVFVSYSKHINATSLMTIAKALGLLTISIIALTYVPVNQLYDVVSALIALGLVAALIVRAMGFLEKFKKPKQQEAPIKSEIKGSFNGTEMTKAFVEPLKVFTETLAKNTATAFKNMAKAFRVISLVAGVVLILSKFVEFYEWLVANKAFEDNTVQARMLVAGGIILGIGAFLAIVAAISNLGDNNATMGGAMSFVTMALGIVIIANAAIKLAEFPKDQLMKAYLVVGAMVLALIGIGFALSQTRTFFSKTKDGDMQKSSNAIWGMVTFILAFAAAFLIMTPAFAILSVAPVENIFWIIAVIGAFGVMIYAMTKFANDMSKDAKNILKGAAAMGAVTLILSLMVDILLMIGSALKIDGAISSLAIGVLAVAGALIAIGGAAWLLEKIGANQALMNFAEACSKFGFGVIALSISLVLLANSFPMIIDAIIYLGQQLNGPARENLLHGLLAIGTVVLLAIALLQPGMIQTIIGFFKTFMSTIMTQLGPLLDTISLAIKQISDWLIGHKVVLIGVVALLIWALFDFLDEIIPNLVDRLFKMLVILVQTLARTILVRGPQLFTALMNVIKAVMTLLLKGIADVVNSFLGIFGIDLSGMFDGFIKSDKLEKEIDQQIEDLQNETDRYEEEAVKTINKANENIEKKTGGLNISGGIKSGGGLAGGVTQLKSMVKGINPGLKGIINIDEITGGQTFDLTSFLGGGKENIFDSASDAYSAIPPAVKEQFGVAEMNADDAMVRINEMMSGAGLTATNTVDQTGYDINSLISGNQQEALDNTETTSDEITQYTNTTGQNVVTAVDENGNEVLVQVIGYTSQIETEVKDGVDNVREYLRDLYKPPLTESEETKAAEDTEETTEDTMVDPMLRALAAEDKVKERARNMIDAFLSEFEKTETEARTKAVGGRMANNLMSGLDKAAMIESPSKEMMWRGQMTVAGLVLGVTKSLTQASHAGTLLATSMLASATNILETSGDVAPTITPVLNMSNVRSGFGTINTLFGRTTLSTALASDAFNGFNQNQILKQEQIQNINSTNADVVAALGLLRGDVNNLNDSFANTQVVLDSGALVGATAKQMDNALGRIKVYKGRGI